MTRMFCILLLLTSMATAETVRISPPRPTFTPVVYPASVYSMTDAAFYAWAMKQNQKAQAAWTTTPRWVTYGAVTELQCEQDFNRVSGSYRTYEPRYLNPDYVTRPLTIINPYCKPARN